MSWIAGRQMVHGSDRCTREGFELMGGGRLTFDDVIMIGLQVRIFLAYDCI